MNLFGTDGIRDLAGKGKLTPESILRIARAVAAALKNAPSLFSRSNKTFNRKRPKVLLSLDTRSSGHMIRGSLLSGLLASGVDILYAGVTPAPACSFLTRHFRCDCGIFISASHNPNEYNGIKFFDRDGFKITEKLEHLIENYYESLTPSEGEIGSYTYREDSLEIYTNTLVEWALKRFDLRGRRIVVDCANGAVTYVIPELFNRLGAYVYLLNSNPDGRNINRGGALFPSKTAKEVKRVSAYIGFSFDGDGDRVIAVDEKGNICDGDNFISIYARYLKNEKKLSNNTVVATVMSNFGLEHSLKEAGIRLLRTKVGDRYVLEEMLKSNAVLGGEQSGHIILLDRTHTGDGIWTALSLLEVMQKTNTPLSSLNGRIKRYPQILINVPTERKIPFEQIPNLSEQLKEAEAKLHGEGRILLRYSGTEPIVRLMVEGKSKTLVKEIAEKIANFLEKTLKHS
ncbi:MAG: phosphoglucosamine mutase [Planctomycetota bacterium]|nr:phosphoglucosamine mutase [Planctomycetota bacterium]